MHLELLFLKITIDNDFIVFFYYNYYDEIYNTLS